MLVEAEPEASTVEHIREVPLVMASGGGELDFMSKVLGHTFNTHFACRAHLRTWWSLFMAAGGANWSRVGFSRQGEEVGVALPQCVDFGQAQQFGHGGGGRVQKSGKSRAKAA